MSTSKMKGLLKGLRYISQIFDEEKEQEMQIGLPTDVKHVAHIGWDGPGPAVDSPSWMKEFKSSRFQSAPLGPPLESRENHEIKWVSEDSKRGHNRALTSSPKKDLPELPKSSRRHSDDNNNNNSNDSPRKQKSRQSRRQQAKDSNTDKSGKPTQESTSSAPDIPRKSRRKKSKESEGGGGGGSTRSKSKGTTSNNTETVFSDPGPGLDTRTMLPKPRSRLSPISSYDEDIQENEIRSISNY